MDVWRPLKPIISSAKSMCNNSLFPFMQTRQKPVPKNDIDLVSSQSYDILSFQCPVFNKDRIYVTISGE